MNIKKTYYVLSGEGDYGYWKRVKATPIGIKRILTRERCNGDCWAKAYEPFHTVDGHLAGVNIDNHDDMTTIQING